MRSLPFILLLFLQYSSRDENNAIFYGQSRIWPGLIDVCTEAFPDEASLFEKRWVKWEKANAKAIKKGQKAYREIELSTGTVDPEAELKKKASEEAEKFRNKSKESERETCDKILDVLNRES